MSTCECPWCSKGIEPGYPESRFTWEYIETVREFAERMGTLEAPNLKLLLEVLTIGARRRHGEKPSEPNPSPMQEPKGLQEPDAQGDDGDHVDELHDARVDGELLDTPQEHADDHQRDQD